MQITEVGSVRVDLVGGTLDIEPIHLVLQNAYTLNVATTLEAKVSLSTIDSQEVIFHSNDYDKKYVFKKEDFTPQKLNEETFGPMTFVALILYHFGTYSGLEIHLTSGAPAGSGLGGSSAMGITLYKALSRLTNKKVDVLEAVSFVKGVEGIILNQGMPGYQDYYPALMGGILALSGSPGRIKVEQLYDDDLKKFLEENLTLVFSGISRNSGINNWEIYKRFFDQDIEIREGMQKIADISYKTFQAIVSKEFSLMKELISKEGEARLLLAPGIVPEGILNFINGLRKTMSIGFKMCGAGGGGCFILVHDQKDKKLIQKKIKEASMTELPFEVKGPFSYA